MFTFFTVIFGLIWAAVSFILLFKVWDVLGPIVLNLTKNHLIQGGVMVLTFLVIFGIPARLWFKIFG